MKRNRGKTRQIQKQEEHKKEQKEEGNIITKKVVLERNLCLAELRKETAMWWDKQKNRKKREKENILFLDILFPTSTALRTV